MKKQILFLFLAVITINAQSQGTFNQFFTQSQKINTTGMYVLGGWAITNLAVGAVGWSQSSGSQRYFHQMNFFWNTVNLGIAGFSFYAFSQLAPLRMTPQELMDMHLKYERLYLINGGLDIAYMGTGLLLKQLSQNNVKREDMYRGYGNSLLIQGAFLFAFDGIMYLLQRNHRIEYLKDMKLTILPDGAYFQLAHFF